MDSGQSAPGGRLAAPLSSLWSNGAGAGKSGAIGGATNCGALAAGIAGTGGTAAELALPSRRRPVVQVAAETLEREPACLEERLWRRRRTHSGGGPSLAGCQRPRCSAPRCRPSSRRSRPVTPSDTICDGRQITLRDQLRVGLKAMTKADFAFIDLVVLRVEQGKLPRKLVDSTFLWARKRVRDHAPGSYRQRPMVYFQPALVLRATEAGHFAVESDGLLGGFGTERLGSELSIR